MSNIEKNLNKDLIYQSWNFTVSTYEFKIPNGNKAWTVLSLAELKTVKKRWSEETKSYYTQSQYITISQEQLIGLLETLKM